MDKNLPHSEQGMTGDRSAEFAVLIARLESATGPNRELDCELHGLIHWPKGGWEVAEIGNDRLGPEIYWTWALLRRTTEKHIIIYNEIPHYTLVIDYPFFATFGTVVKIVSITLLGDGRYEARALDRAGNCHVGEGATEAIARLIAGLKARTATPSTERSPDTIDPSNEEDVVKNHSPIKAPET